MLSMPTNGYIGVDDRNGEMNALGQVPTNGAPYVYEAWISERAERTVGPDGVVRRQTITTALVPAGLFESAYLQVGGRVYIVAAKALLMDPADIIYFQKMKIVSLYTARGGVGTWEHTRIEVVNDA